MNRFPVGTRFIVPEEKLTRYLLSETHTVGKWKARAFQHLGIDAHTLSKQLVDIGRDNKVVRKIDNVHGTKYVVDGLIVGRGGLKLSIRTVWITGQDSESVRFVTAYPRRGKTLEE